MEKNLDLIASDLYNMLAAQFTSLEVGDSNSKVLPITKDTIGKGRTFRFNYEKDGVNLGNITINIDDDALSCVYFKDITKNQPPDIVKKWYDFQESLGDFAVQHGLRYDSRNVNKTNLDKRDYEYFAQGGESKMTESKLFGTSRTSFQKIGEAQIIVKHSQPVNFEHPAGRTLHIESIFVENAEGERFKYPIKHLNGARALAMHVSHGGTPYDNIGQHIVGLSEELSKLRMFKNYVVRSPMVSEAMGTINNRVVNRIDSIKKEISSLQSKAYYNQFAESFETQESKVIPEDIMNDWVDRLTIKTFNEELKDVFPYLYKIVDESELPIKEISSDQFVVPDMSSGTVDNVQEEIEELQDFEAYMNKLVSEAISNQFGIFSEDPDERAAAIGKLNEKMQEAFPAGTDGTNAIMFLKQEEIIDEPELNDMIKEAVAAENDAEANGADLDVRALIKEFIETNAPEILGELELPADLAPEAAELPTDAPAQEPMVDQEPVQPQTESKIGQKLLRIKELAESEGRDFDTIKFNIRGKEYNLSEALVAFNLVNEDNDDDPLANREKYAQQNSPGQVYKKTYPGDKVGMSKSYAFDIKRTGPRGKLPKEEGMQQKGKMLALEIHEMVKSLCNTDATRMDQGPFPLGEEGVVTKVTKDICEKHGREEDERFKMAVENFCRECVSRMNSMFETNRMKKLAGL